MSDSDNLPEKRGEAEEQASRRFALWARLFTSLGSLAVTAGVAVWLFQVFLIATPEEGQSRFSAFFSLLGSDILNVGLPLLLMAVTLFFTAMLAGRAFSEVSSVSLGRIAEAIVEVGLFGLRVGFPKDRAPSSPSDPEVRDALRARVRFLNRKVRELSKKIEDVETPAGIFSAMCDRLEDERARLAKNSGTNLLIGIVASLIALVVLGLPLIRPEVVAGDESILNATFWRQYATRLPVGILLQFVAFFFLRLYVSCEMDIKSNKNEVTNIESRYFAYVVANNNDGKGIESLISSLSATERNFILKRGERTISIENDSRFNDMKETIDKLIDAIGAAVSKKSPE